MKKKIIGIIGIAVIAGAALIYINGLNQAIEVNTAKVSRGDISEYVEELGTVKVQDHENIYAPISGKISEILVDVGDDVKTGDVLIKLDGEEISRKIDEIEAQKAALSAEYNEATVSNDIAKEKLELSIVEMKKNVEVAQRDWSNSQALFEIGGISEDEYQAAVRNLEAQKNQLAQLELDLERINKPVSQNIIAGYQAQLKQLDIQKEGLAKSKKDVTIVSGINGKVLNKSAEKGSYLQAGTLLLEVGNLDQLYIESDLLMGDMAEVKEGGKVQISSKELKISDASATVNKIYPQAISKISDLGVEQKRVKIEIALAENIANLRPGYDVDIRVITDSKNDILIIPENAVFQMDGKKFVFVNENDKATIREIKTGLESERMVEVLEGLEENEIVVQSPDEKIEEGKKIISIVQE